MRVIATARSVPWRNSLLSHCREFSGDLTVLDRFSLGYGVNSVWVWTTINPNFCIIFDTDQCASLPRAHFHRHEGCRAP